MGHIEDRVPLVAHRHSSDGPRWLHNPKTTGLVFVVDLAPSVFAPQHDQQKTSQSDSVADEGKWRNPQKTTHFRSSDGPRWLHNPRTTRLVLVVDIARSVFAPQHHHLQTSPLVSAVREGKWRNPQKTTHFRSSVADKPR